RWALRQADGELALEAALTLEDLQAGQEARRQDARRRLGDVVSAPAAVHAGDVVLEAILTGLAEPALVAAMADEARGYYDQAVELEPDRAPGLAERRARLELAALRPAAAVALLARAVEEPGVSPRLVELYNDASVALREAG